MARKTLVTSALPYANGPIHLGHLVEYLQTDMYVRYLRLRGEDVIYVCASDTHGTPIELNARKAGVSPEEFVGRYNEEHPRDFAAFGIEFDCFYTTHSPENERLAGQFFERAKAGGHITEKTTAQMFDEKEGRFLPDRFVRGTCPRCGAGDQYGDSCENCGYTYEPKDLIEPKSVLSGETPVLKDSTHLYFTLADYAEFLNEWLGGDPAPVVDEIKNYLANWIEGGLDDWCISRDAPYFGFPIPGVPDKFFYVWLDAPIGYISATEKWAAENGGDASDYWDPEKGARIVHFIGKDIVYFHTLFWPAMLKAAGYQTPEKVAVHGFLTVDGAKMSKSKGTFITAQQYLEHIDPQYLRYYYAANLSQKPDDLDLNLDDFVAKVNSELVGNLVNFCYRSLSFCKKQLKGKLGTPERGELEADILKRAEAAGEAFGRLEYRKALIAINELGDVCNRYFQEAAPWKLVKEDPARAEVVVTTAVNMSRALAVLLRPVLPGLVEKIEVALGMDRALSWGDLPFTLENTELGNVEQLVGRLDRKALDKVVDLAAAAAAEEAAKNAPPPKPAPIEPEISIDDFFKVDLRVGQVMEAERVKKSKKLLKLSVDIGEESGPRTVVAGIGQAYEPEALVGKRVMIVANLAPAKLMGIESQGMVCAAGPGGSDIILAGFPDQDGDRPHIGTRIK